jgi:hypothetical protein
MTLQTVKVPRTISEVEVFDKAEKMHDFIMNANQELILRQANAFNQHGDLVAVYQKSTNNKHP